MNKDTPDCPFPSESAENVDAALEAFHAGDRDVIAEVYRAHFAAIERAIGRILAPADKETVIHEVFLRLLTNAELRLRFRGGSMRAWLVTVARNLAIDYARRLNNEELTGDAPDGVAGSESPGTADRAMEARILVDRFRRDHLPKKWAAVFELRFIGQLEQAQAARELGIGRSTLAYREYRIRHLLRRFLIGS